MPLKLSTVIFKLFYLTVHFVFTIYELLVNLYKTSRNKLLNFRHEFVPVNKKLVKVEKIPNHVTFLLGAEEPALKDLANLVLWCLAFRITFVTFYDYKGKLKKNEERLHQVVQEKTSACDHVIWHSLPGTGCKNGFLGRKIHIKILSGCDGTEGVVHLTKQLASAGINPDLTSFDEGLKKHFEFPEPELGVCCGKTFSLDGYPPWQIRLTEFFTLSFHHHLTFDIFVDLLRRYNRCQQRYGK